MTTLAQRPDAEAAPLDDDAYEGPATQPADAVSGATAFPPWSTLSWEERADFVARHCL